MNQKIRSWSAGGAGANHKDLRFQYDEDGYRGRLDPKPPTPNYIGSINCFAFYQKFIPEVEKEFNAFFANLNLTGSELKDYIHQNRENPVRHDSFKRIDYLSLTPSYFKESGNQFEFTLHAQFVYSLDEVPVKYEGTVVRAEKDTRVFGYRTIITRPAVDTRTYEYIQEYRGTVMKKGNDTRTYEHYYQYELTIEYE